MAGGIRGYYGSGVGAADAITPRTSTPIPDRNPYKCPGLPFGVYLVEYNPKAGDAQPEPGLPGGIWICDDEYIPLPAGHGNFATDAEAMQNMFAAKRVHEESLPSPSRSPPKLIAIDDNGINKSISTIRRAATTTGSQAGCSTSIQFHCSTPQQEDNRARVCGDNGDQCPTEDEEIEIKELQ